MALSEKAQAIEDANAKKAMDKRLAEGDITAKSNMDITQTSTIFWARASSFRLGAGKTDWGKEERAIGTGQVLKREKTIRFTEHIHVTDDPVIADFIKGSEAFKRQDIREAETVQVAQGWTRLHDQKKKMSRNVELQGESVESTDIT